MRLLIVCSLICLSLAAELNTYKEYLVFAAKNHYKNVSDFANAIGLQDFDTEFNDFKIKFNRNYSPEEEDERKYNFLQSLQYIRSHNKKYENRDVSHEVGLNQFADWSSDEYSAQLTTQTIAYNMSISTEDSVPALYASLPASFDWRQTRKVTAIKNQGQCGSCWAFATTATIESAVAIRNSQYISLSEQNLVDCVKGVYQSNGCKGGNVYEAMRYVRDHGVEYSNDYRYLAKDENCLNSVGKSHFKISGMIQLPHMARDEDIMLAIMNHGPVAVNIDCDGNDFKFYRGGVITSGPKTMNHYVTAIGWGPNYWIVKNSWGTSWGEQGFGKIARGSDVRGFNSWLFYPIL